MFRVSLLLLASLAIAAAQSKVAVVDLQNAVTQSAEFKRGITELEGRYKPRYAEMEKIAKELADMKAQLDGGKLTPQQAESLTLTGQRRERQLERLKEDYQADVNREQQDLVQRTRGRMDQVIQKLADERGFDVVLDVSTRVYHKQALEITKDVIAAYDKAYPSAATAAAAAPAAPAAK